MKWYYDKQRKEWYTMETVSYKNDSFSIRKDNNQFKLETHFRLIGYFKKLKTAKLIAYHLLNG